MHTAHWNRPAWLPDLLWFRRECPRCNGGQFKVAELRPFDGLLGMFALKPVRCVFCWRRYYGFAFLDLGTGRDGQ